MNCIKTGAHIFLHQYREYAWCDLFKIGGVMVARIVETSRQPLNGCDVIHAEVLTIGEWFDRGDQGNTETLVSSSWIEHGPQGSLICDRLG